MWNPGMVVLPPGLLAAAMEAGVNLRRWIDGDGPGLRGA